MAVRHIASPVGRLTLVAGDRGLAAILWEHDRRERVRLPTSADDTPVKCAADVLGRAEAQLAAYFAGRRTTFDVVLDVRGTAFQRAVWAALLAIPFGETRTYRDVAVAVGNSNASRAVGAAIGRNPVAIVVPCHRAVGANGTLTGFAGGLDAKRRLLALESRQDRMRGAAGGRHGRDESQPSTPSRCGFA